MQIEKPPVDRDVPEPGGERRGLVIVHTGDGKGMGTAAFGPALRAHGRAEATLRAGGHFLVVLDEITCPLRDGWLPVEPAPQAPRERPPHVHVVPGGRGAPAERVSLADTVTGRVPVEQHDKAGVPAQRGIED